MEYRMCLTDRLKIGSVKNVAVLLKFSYEIGMVLSPWSPEVVLILLNHGSERNLREAYNLQTKIEDFPREISDGEQTKIVLGTHKMTTE